MKKACKVSLRLIDMQPFEIQTDADINIARQVFLY